ncbi:microtubule-associated serine/threonine-protein kinase 3 [Schistocerca cancellata]|uniref:microtubule-associated serine/threonine-protein kinase 3 n=1 Tax=Schistocerca cancellata TaxID=274614 RepID=UPI00211958B2|nr:microtubule-associated serine/threonine-protein kinase 3 [Schistocerca cancellata]
MLRRFRTRFRLCCLAWSPDRPRRPQAPDSAVAGARSHRDALTWPPATPVRGASRSPGGEGWGEAASLKRRGCGCGWRSRQPLSRATPRLLKYLPSPALPCPAHCVPCIPPATAPTQARLSARADTQFGNGARLADGTGDEDGELAGPAAAHEWSGRRDLATRPLAPGHIWRDGAGPRGRSQPAPAGHLAPHTWPRRLCVNAAPRRSDLRTPTAANDAGGHGSLPLARPLPPHRAVSSHYSRAILEGFWTEEKLEQELRYGACRAHLGSSAAGVAQSRCARLGASSSGGSVCRCGAEHLAALAVGQAPQRAAKSAHVTRARLELTHGAAAFTGASAGVRARGADTPPLFIFALPYRLAQLASLPFISGAHRHAITLSRCRSLQTSCQSMSAASASPPALAPGAGRRRKSCAAREGDASPAGKRARHFRPWRATPHHASEPAAAASAAPAAHEHDRLPPSPPPTSGESRLSSPPPRCDLTPPTSSASPTPPPPPAKPDSPAHCSRLGAAQSPPPAALASLQDADSRHQSTPPTAPPILLRLPHTLTPPDGADGPSLRHSPPPLPPPPTLAPPPQLLLRVPPTHPYTALELRPSEPLSLVLRHQAEPPRDSAPPPRDVPPPPPTLDPAPQSSQQQQQQQQAPRNYKNMTRERRIEANARERTRVHTISAAFDTLRRAVPSYAHAQKLSKLSVLRIASAYIMTLARVAGYDYSRDGSRPSLAECVDQVSRTIQTEGRLRRKKDD